MSGAVFQADEVNSSGLEPSVRVLRWVSCTLGEGCPKAVAVLAELSWVESSFLEAASLLLLEKLLCRCRKLLVALPAVVLSIC